MAERKCPVCGNTDVGEYIVPIPQKYHCYACKTVFSDDTHADRLAARVAELEKENAQLKGIVDDLATPPDFDTIKVLRAENKQQANQISQMHTLVERYAAENAQLKAEVEWWKKRSWIAVTEEVAASKGAENA